MGVHLQASNKKQQNISTHQRTNSLNCKLERANIPKKESDKATVDKSIEEKLCFHSVSHLHCCSYGNSVSECPSLDPWPPTQPGTGEVGGRGRLPVQGREEQPAGKMDQWREEARWG